MAPSAVDIMSMTDSTKLLMEQATLKLRTISSAVIALQQEMNALAKFCLNTR